MLCHDVAFVPLCLSIHGLGTREGCTINFIWPDSEASLKCELGSSTLGRHCEQLFCPVPGFRPVIGDRNQPSGYGRP